MRKGMLVAAMIAVFVSVASMAFAEVGFQYRIPMQMTGQKELKDVSGQGSLLTFDLDDTMKAGILRESINFNDNSAAGAGAFNTYTVNALRISKMVLNPVAVGFDFGIAKCGTVSRHVADLFGSVLLLKSTGKVASFLNVELLYRFMKDGMGTAGVTDFSGTMVSLGVGINF